jgi:hypothetical protein
MVSGGVVVKEMSTSLEHHWRGSLALPNPAFQWPHLDGDKSGRKWRQ